ncbi:MAG: hypothetical protein ABIE68_01695 [bacterium]
MNENQIKLEETAISGVLRFAVLPGERIASFDHDLSDQIRIVSSKLKIIDEAVQSGVVYNDELLVNLMESTSFTSQQELDKELEQWQDAAMIYSQTEEGEIVGISEIAPAIRWDQIFIVTVYDEKTGNQIAKILNPPDDDLLAQARLAYHGSWSDDRIYVTGTTEPILYVLEEDSTKNQLKLVNKIDLWPYLEEFQYHSPKDGLDFSKYPVWGYTPIWQPLALNGDCVITMLEKKNVLVVIDSTGNCVGAVKTMLTPVSVSGGLLVAVNGNKLYTFTSTRELLRTAAAS